MFYNLKSRETLDSKPPSLTILNKNILYLTHTMDKCLVVLKELQHDNHLQKQVDEYFEEGAEHGIEDTRTSHQTDPEEQ